jgi:mRNA-degrading endonuclease RelE of RelBE toxin-antitoxin system
MAWRIKFSSKANGDYDEGYSWYEDKQEGLGQRFLMEVRNKVRTIESNPEIFGNRTNKKFREAKLDHFPYSIIYRLDKEDQTVYITSIHHNKKHPRSKYKKR